MRDIAKKPLLVLLILTLILTLSCSERERVDLLFFYLEICPSCDDYQMAEDFNATIRDLDKRGIWSARYYNLINPEGSEELKKVLREKSLPDVSRSLPLLIVGDEYINGYENIGKTLEKLSAGPVRKTE